MNNQEKSITRWLANPPLVGRKPDWIICGGESGPKHRPFEWDWARSLRDQCHEYGISFWMKQGGGYPNSRHDLADIPEDLRIRELPQK